MICRILPLLIVIFTVHASAQEFLTSVAPGGDDKFASADYFMWIPDGVDQIEGVIVHQHGCGESPAKAGRISYKDIQWRALAQKWNFALMSASYKQNSECLDWSDPANGSEAAFLTALSNLARQSNHAELVEAPWVLWGHSGGGLWSYLMFTKHHERTLAVVLQSPAQMEPFDVGFDVPILCVLGVREAYDRFSTLWVDAIVTMKDRRKKGGRVCIAPDPSSSHDCKDSRQLAIPFIDACLSERQGGFKNEFFGDLNFLGYKNSPPEESKAAHSSWLPNERVAKFWQEFVRTGNVTDNTPPPEAPSNLEAKQHQGASVLLTWDAIADIESGIKSFAIYRNGELVDQVYGRSPQGEIIRNFTSNNYFDSPREPLPKMKFIDDQAVAGKRYGYQVSIINGSGLESPKSKAVPFP